MNDLTSILDQIRYRVPANTRARAYAIVTALVAVLVPYGLVSEQLAPSVTGVALAAVTLLYATLHSTSSARIALYGFASAAGVLAVAFGWSTEEQIAGILAVAAPVLGLSTAAATTGTWAGSEDTAPVVSEQEG